MILSDILDNFRFAGVLAALALAAYALLKYRYRGGWRRSDLLLGLAVALGIGLVSVFPAVIGEPFTRLFGLEDRGFAILTVSNLALFGCVLYLLNQVRLANRRGGLIVSALAARQYIEQTFPPEERVSLSQAKNDGVMIVIPAYNEAGSIREVLGRVPRELHGRSVRTLVVVDGSSDETEAVTITEGFPVATHVVNLGQGDALRTGFEVARQRKAEVVVNLDADGQYLPEDVERLVAPVLENEADFVLGSRFRGYYEEAGSVRHAGVVFFSKLVSILTGQKITDCTNGLRAIRVSRLGELDLREESFNATELILEALRKGLRYREIPVTMLRRFEGESKKPPKLAYPFGVFRVIVRTWLR